MFKNISILLLLQNYKNGIVVLIMAMFRVVRQTVIKKYIVIIIFHHFIRCIHFLCVVKKLDIQLAVRKISSC